MTTHHRTETSTDPAMLGQFTPHGVTQFRCPCSIEPVTVCAADRQGRIVADPDWGEHQTVTCGHCGRYGRLEAAAPDNAAVTVLGVAPLPAGCADCGAERGQPCQEPFCPGQDVLDPDPELDPCSPRVKR